MTKFLAIYLVIGAVLCGFADNEHHRYCPNDAHLTTLQYTAGAVIWALPAIAGIVDAWQGTPLAPSCIVAE